MYLKTPSRRFSLWLVISILVILYVVVRSLNLDLFVTTDEPFWLGRSANFYRALVQHDFAHTYQMAHPGVMTMWAGTLAYWISFPEYAHEITGNLSFAYGIGGVLRQLGQDPLHILIVARISKIVMQAVFFAICLGFLQRLFGRSVMILAGMFIAFDPFLSGMDSLLHVDGLFAITSLAAILALASAARAQADAMAPWLAAGALAALAWMTRATGLAILAMVAAIVVAQAWSRWRMRRHGSLRAVLETPAFALMLWASGAGAVSLMVLPALWVDPFGTMQQVWDWSANAATEGHEHPTFFHGIHTGDPGLLFYPVTLLWRLTPIVLLGAMMAFLLVAVGYRRGWMCRESLSSLAILAGYAVIYAGAMSVGAKKFDRYILPVYPIVAVFAAVGVVLFARWLASLRPNWKSLALPVVATLFISGQVLSLVTAIPYRLDYFTPVFGGLARAQHAVQVGWGEGGGEVMAFIIDDAAGSDVTVQKSSATPVFSYFATPNVHFDDFGLGTPAGWYETDYFVVGIQEWQRDLSPSYRLMQQFEPVDVVTIDGVPFFKTYTPGRSPLPETLRGETGCSARFGNQVQLMQIIGRDGTIDLYWMGVGDQPRKLDIRVTLSLSDDEGGPMPAQTATLLVAGDGKMSKATVADPRAEGSAPLARYTMTVEVDDPASGQALPATFGGHAVEDAFVTDSECFSAEGATP